MLLPEETIKQLVAQFNLIPLERREILHSLSSFIAEHNQDAHLVFICTHNSRRSHMAQIWSETAAAYYKIAGVKSYSGGTEATAFNPRAVQALREIGFDIQQISNEVNPRYRVIQADDRSFEVFSKKYDHPTNPSTGFVAIMTCTHADENCPVVAGAAARYSLPYDDPKDFDGTELESTKYHERALEIGREILYMFSQIRKQ